MMNITTIYNEYQPTENSYLAWLLSRLQALRDNPTNTALWRRFETALCQTLGMVDSLKIARHECLTDIEQQGNDPATWCNGYNPVDDLAEIETYLNFYLGA